MAEEVKEKVPKKKVKVKTEAKPTAGSSVRYYKQGIEVEKQKMGAYSKKFGTTVKSLQADFKKHAKDVKAAAEAMREDGIKNMSEKVTQFKGDIKYQIKEHKEAVSRIKNGIKFFLSEINKKKNEFKAYSRAFWGVS